jgi:ANTAR domain/GAF domain
MVRSSADDPHRLGSTARDIAADERDETADRRERLDDVREGVLDRWERELTERAQALQMLDDLDLVGQRDARDRRAAAHLRRREAGEQRRAAAIERDIDLMRHAPMTPDAELPPDARIQQMMDGIVSLGSDDSTLAGVIDAVLAITIQAVADAAAASISLPVDGQLSSAASTASWATDLDAVQLARQAGPIVDALDTRSVIVSNDLASDDRWDLRDTRGPDARRSVISVGFDVGDRQPGALTIYARPGARFDQHSRTTAALLAGQASLAIRLSIERLNQAQLAEAWERAIASRDQIGQAKGLLMALQQVSSDTAFELMRKTSQRLNIKVRQVAEHVLVHHRLPDATDP